MEEKFLLRHWSTWRRLGTHFEEETKGSGVFLYVLDSWEHGWSQLWWGSWTPDLTTNLGNPKLSESGVGLTGTNSSQGHQNKEASLWYRRNGRNVPTDLLFLQADSPGRSA